MAEVVMPEGVPKWLLVKIIESAEWISTGTTHSGNRCYQMDVWMELSETGAEQMDKLIEAVRASRES